MELLRLECFEDLYRLLRKFRAVCRKEGTTPRKALEDFLKVYAEE